MSIDKATLQEIPVIKDRITYVYLEHCKINRQDGAITVLDIRGTVHIPAAVLSVVMLGPGSNITHRAVQLLGEAGVSILWVGEEGVRFYAYGSPLTHSSKLLIRQATLASNVHKRASVVKAMYKMRFTYVDDRNYTIQELRGKEGARMRSLYRKLSKEFKVPWDGRNYDVDNFNDGSPVNQALSAGNVCLYGLCHSVILSMGCSPGLGFVHNGHERSFVYDMADLYKSQYVIPYAFQLAAQEVEDIGSEMRKLLRDKFRANKLIVQIVGDIQSLLNVSNDNLVQADVLTLWDNKQNNVPSGVLYTNENNVGGKKQE
ncbi:type I-E CRISPR-associated endonuclease Cas1e [Megasphaera sueciensis]|uniref:type I-E CRISPR-associated endonuclease Cas1e n=1 Tax=Megasphaera sueciensis TaxID=349094 RepID=UPI003D024037